MTPVGRTELETTLRKVLIMSEVRKVRGDAKLERLSADQHEQLLVWLDEENRTYLEVAALIRTEFGLSVGKSAVADYWRRHVMPQRCREQIDTATEFAALPEGKFVEALVKLAKGEAWSALSQPRPDVRKATAMMSLVHGVERADIARQRMALAERRAAIAERLAVQSHPTRAQPLRAEAELLQEISSAPDTALHPPAPQNPPLYPGSAAVGCDSPEVSEIISTGSEVGTHELPAVYEKEAQSGSEKWEPVGETTEPQAAAEQAHHLDAMPEPWRLGPHQQETLPPTNSPLFFATASISSEPPPIELKKAS